MLGKGFNGASPAARRGNNMKQQSHVNYSPPSARAAYPSDAMAAPLKRPKHLGVMAGLNRTPPDGREAFEERDRGASGSHALQKQLLPFGDHTPTASRAHSGGDSLPPIFSPPKNSASSKLPPLRQRNPLGSPISVSLNNKAAGVGEECRANEAYGAPPRRPANHDVVGGHKFPQQASSEKRRVLDSFTEAGTHGSSRNPAAQGFTKQDAATSHLRKQAV